MENKEGKPKADLRKVSLEKVKIGLPLSEDQKLVLRKLVEWLRNSNEQFITVGGYAGTGKTTLISVLRQVIKQSSPEVRVAFGCYTGKASQVLMNKLRLLEAVFKGDYGGTIHSLMYSPEMDDKGRVVKWVRNKVIEQQLIIIDEASMVDERIWEDLRSYEIRMIVVGDHGQLPPIASNHVERGQSVTGVEGKFNLMAGPKLKLEKIHRQVAGNPILKVASLAREQGVIPVKDFGATVRKVQRGSQEAQWLWEEMLAGGETLVLCGYNRTRVQLNQAIRGQLGRESPEPVAGDRVICVKNIYENESGPIYNGMVGLIEEIRPEGEHWYEVELYFPDEDRWFRGNISRHQFNQEKLVEAVPGVSYAQIGERFDFGYALTVHKAQGSQAKRVLLFEERFPRWEPELWRRWLYTGVTRAVEELYVVG